MKVLLYTEGEKMTSNSGLGKAIKHQMKALESANVEYTTNLKDDYDIIHINFYGPRSYHLAKKAHRKGCSMAHFQGILHERCLMGQHAEIQSQLRSPGK